MSKSLRFFAIVMLMMTAYGCAVSPQVKPAYLEVLPGSIFVITQPISIPPDEAGVYIRNGKVQSSNLISRYHPHCRLETNDVLETSQTLSAGEYRVTEVLRDEELESVGVSIFSEMSLFDTGIDNYSTTFLLQASNDQKRLDLICQHWVDSGDAEHLTLDQIRQALGELIEIKRLAKKRR